MGKTQSDRSRHEKGGTYKYVLEFLEDKNGNTIMNYDFGVYPAKILIYNMDSENKIEFDLTGSGRKLINKKIFSLPASNASSVAEETYLFYDLFINGQFILTGKIKPYRPQKVKKL